LRSLWYNNKFAADYRREMDFLSTEEIGNWIEHYLDRQPAVGKQ
jgi:hypothetical protein